MKPEVVDKWNEAIDRFKAAERHLRTGAHEAARTEARSSAIVGAWAVLELLIQQTEEKTPHHVAESPLNEALSDWARECPGPRDYVERARRLLMEFIALSPPENKLWGEDILKPRCQ
jgi:hypothetical protein